MVAIIVIVGSAKGRYFNNLRSEAHMGEAKAAPNQAAVAEQFAHLIRAGVGRDVKILGFTAEQ